MEDEELTRMAIEELVRGMGDISEPTVRERKINPVAKPNKRFLGRTINSMLCHNKRKNERTQENCRKKLRELDDNQRRYERNNSKDHRDSRELSLSSSEHEDSSRDINERKKMYTKVRSKKLKKGKKAKQKKSKYIRRDSSSSDSSKSSTSKSSDCERKRKSVKHRKRKNPHRTQKNAETCRREYEDEEVNTYYEPCNNVDINFNTALWANTYGEHHMQEILKYNTVMANREAAENKDVLEELKLSDVDDFKQYGDVASVSTAPSSLRLDGGSSQGSDVLQITVSSASSSSSVPPGYKIMRKKRTKKRAIKDESGGSSNCLILDLDSDNSKDSTILNCQDCDVKNIEEQRIKDRESLETLILELDSDSDNSKPRNKSKAQDLASKKLEEESHKHSESESSSNCLIVDSDTQSLKASKQKSEQGLKEKLVESGDCICIASASSAGPDTDSKESSSASSANETDVLTDLPNNNFCSPPNIVMLISTSESELDVMDIDKSREEQDNEKSTNISSSRTECTTLMTIQKESEGYQEPLNLSITDPGHIKNDGQDFSKKSISPELSEENHSEQIELKIETELLPNKDIVEFSDTKIRATKTKTTSTIPIETTTDSSHSISTPQIIVITSANIPESFAESKLDSTEERNECLTSATNSISPCSATSLALRKVHSKSNSPEEQPFRQPVPMVETLDKENTDFPNIFVQKTSFTITKAATSTEATTTSFNASTSHAISNESKASSNEEPHDYSIVVKNSIATNPLAATCINSEFDSVFKKPPTCKLSEETKSSNNSNNVMVASKAGLTQLPIFSVTSTEFNPSEKQFTIATTSSEAVDCLGNQSDESVTKQT